MVLKRMFNRIINFINDIRINSSYPDYEQKLRTAYVRHGEEIFATADLHAARNKIDRQIEEDADKEFRKDIMELQQKIQTITSKIDSNEKMLGFFLRKYKDELAEAYTAQKALLEEKPKKDAQLSELKTQLSKAYDGKKGAYADAEDYQDDIDGWYDKAERSPWFGGNSGHEIPRRSFFGQSKGDLYSSCAGRNDAYENVGYWRGEIIRLKEIRQRVFNRLDAIKSKLDDINKTIVQIKADRDYTFKLKKEGHRDHKLKKEIAELRARLEQEKAELGKKNSSRSKFVKEKNKDSGAAAIQLKIQDIEKRRIEYITRFDLEENKTKRIAEHREAWLNKRNLA